MANLPVAHPSVYEAFSAGKFYVQLSSNNPFGRIPVDQATEVTVNKNTLTTGGTTKFSLKSGAVKHFYVTSDHRSTFLNQMREIVNESKTDTDHADLQTPRIKRDGDAVSQLVSLLNSWVNPFAAPSCLVSISTARAVPQGIAIDLKRELDVGEKCYADFKTEHLECSLPTKRFHDAY